MLKNIIKLVHLFVIQKSCFSANSSFEAKHLKQIKKRVFNGPFRKWGFGMWPMKNGVKMKKGNPKQTFLLRDKLIMQGEKFETLTQNLQRNCYNGAQQAS